MTNSTQNKSLKNQHLASNPNPNQVNPDLKSLSSSISDLKSDKPMNKSLSIITGANISILEENEDIASTKDSDLNSLYSLNDQMFSKLFPNNDRKMSVVSLMSCKEPEHDINSKSNNDLSLYYKVLIQGLDSNDVDKVKKWLQSISNEDEVKEREALLVELKSLNRDYLNKLLVVLLRVMSAGGCA